jgi:hypothetical protein
MPEPLPIDGVAHNQATESQNRIHADDVARRYGFRGGLVPGVTVYAYLVQPAVVAWGEDFFKRGAARIVLRKPLYEGARFRVELGQGEAPGYAGRVVDEAGTVCAEGGVTLTDAAPPPLARRGDPPAPEPAQRRDATRAALEALRERGLGSIRLPWRGEGEMGRTHRTFDEMPDLIRPDRRGLANPAFLLGLANWVLSSNVRLGPWIHAQSEVRHVAAAPLGCELVTEATVTDLFERGGHEFVDLDVAVFDAAEDRPVLHASHRAIYRLRDPAA